MTTSTRPAHTDRLGWLIEAMQSAADRDDWRTATDHATEARAIVANRARFDRRLSRPADLPGGVWLCWERVTTDAERIDRLERELALTNRRDVRPQR